MRDDGTNPIGAVMVLGGGIAGMQASLDLAESGIKVYLVERSPSIGGKMAQLDKTFPTNDCAMCIISPKLVECGRHKDIEILSNSEIVELTGEPGHFTATILRHANYIDTEKCTGCGECAQVCPVGVPSEFDEGLGMRKAIYIPFQQAIPKVFAIQKRGWSPCRHACPAGVKAQGYIALISQGKFKEALEVVRNTMPFPSVCGRVCVHPCERECERGKVDEPLAIMALKRFAADYELRAGREEVSPIERTKEEKVAIIGSGPAGLACAYDLVQQGYGVTVFEALPVAGGMLAVGIPEYRLPKEVLKREIDYIEGLGVEIKTNTPVGDGLTLNDLSRQGYAAAFIAVGAQHGSRLNIPDNDLKGTLVGLSFLRDINLGKKVEVGQRVLVLGGGNVAFDCARSALRLGASEVHMACVESREEMPADPSEIEEGEGEGIVIHPSRTFTRIIGQDDGHVAGVECLNLRSMFFDDEGRLHVDAIEGSEHVLEADTVIYAVGQRPNLDFLSAAQGMNLSRRGTIVVDPETLHTGYLGVFAGGDTVSGPASVIEAVAAGKEAAISIDHWLRRIDLKGDRPAKLEKVQDVPKDAVVKQPRNWPQVLDAEKRKRSFDEVVLTLDEQSAIEEAKRCLNCAVCSECLQCVAACQANAPNHLMKDEFIELNVGAVLACPGYSLYDTRLSEEFGFGRYANVVTSMQFERMLSASGPTRGHLERPSDHEEPKRIAFLQCIGSRDQKHQYCSSVCCMYATKEAMLAQDHAPGVECNIFYMDIRAFGKGFDAFYQRAINQGVKYIPCHPSSLREVPLNRNLLLRYQKENGELLEEEFDLVVLSVGMEAPMGADMIAQSLGIKINESGFCYTTPFSPVETSRPGVFVAGTFHEPMDIPDSVTEGSGAAAGALSLVGKSRGTMLSEKVYPPETDVEGAEPRIGVFVCHCGSNIAGVVDVDSVAEFAKTLPHVVSADHLLYTCSADALKTITERIAEFGLNRVVVSSCTPRTHETLFQDTIREAGLNPYLFEMANIRDQCSWVHSHDPERATKKAKSLVAMAVGRAALLEPLHKEHLGLSHAALVVGGGVAGMTAALVLAEQGFQVYLLEQGQELGGRLLHMWNTVEGGDPRAYVNSLIERVEANHNIEVITRARVLKTGGFVGNFKTTIASLDDPTQRLIEHGVTIMATGGQEYRGNEYLLGQDERVMTMGDLEERIQKSPDEVAKAGEVAMILCVGPWEEKSKYCSRICCTVSIKNAIKTKELSPSAKVYVLHKDLRSYGFKERLYTEAREKGVIFIRYTDEKLPRVETVDGRLQITVLEPNLNEELKLSPDILALATAVLPDPSAKELSPTFKVPLTQEGFFLEAHVKLRPEDFASEGIFLCGTAHYPKFIDETIAQAMAAAARATAILSKEHLEVGGAVSKIDPDKCVGCLTCCRICPYQVPKINAQGVAEVEMANCQGCGICAAECPAKAIGLLHYRDVQIEAKAEALMKH